MKLNLILTLISGLLVPGSAHSLPPPTPSGEPRPSDLNSTTTTDSSLESSATMDLKPTENIPEQLEVLSYYLRSPGSCDIYEIGAKNGSFSGEYVLLPIMTIEAETGIRIFEPYMIRITIVPKNLIETAPEVTSIPPEDEPQEDDDDYEDEGDNFLEAFMDDITLGTTEAQIVTTTVPPTHFSDEARKPKIVVPRDADNPGREHWTARFLSWFTLVLYATLMLTFIILLILNCCCANLAPCSRSNSLDSLDEEVSRAALPPSARPGGICELSNGKRRSYYEPI